jgi:predicted ribosomally synthesized peptide with SipW-like signal peptide
MSDDGMNLSRRKVLGGITTVGAASAAAGAGTFALFSDTSQTNTSTISTGTVSFKDGNPTPLDIDAKNQGSSGSISGSTKFTYKGSKDAAFVIGMRVENDVDGDGEGLADQINVTSAKITVKDKIDNSPDGTLAKDTLSSGVDTDNAGKVLNALESSESKPTLADLKSALSKDASIDIGDTNGDGSTESISALKFYGPLKKDDYIKLDLAGEWSGLDNKYQGQKIKVTVYGKVVEMPNA